MKVEHKYDTVFNLLLTREILEDLMILQAGEPELGDYNGRRIYRNAERRVHERANEAKRSRIRAEINQHLQNARGED